MHIFQVTCHWLSQKISFVAGCIPGAISKCFLCFRLHTRSFLKRFPIFQVAYQGLPQKISYVSGCIPGAVSKDSGAIPWQDVIVTEMKEGGIFWAHIGEDTMKRVAEVQAVLNKGGLETVDRVLKGESVAVFGKIQDTPCFLRAQVGITIFALSAGFKCKHNIGRTGNSRPLNLSSCPLFPILITVKFPN